MALSLLGVDGPLRPQPLEVACGLTVDVEPSGPRLPTQGRAHPRDALEARVRCALAHPPCLVSFSGGRDSSAVLATAAAVARREGLPLPVPATYRFPDAPGTHENEWQEQVLRHLRLPDWECLTVSHELDSIGPVAQAVLRRHGLLWPFNAHFLVPLCRLAEGGSLLTGVGGDEVLGPQRWWTARAVLSGRRRPRLRHYRTLGLAVSPLLVRRMVLARRPEIRWPWLRPEVEALVNRRRASWEARTPLRWSAAVDWWWRSRSRAVLSATLQRLGSDAGTRLVQPFLDASVVGAFCRRYGARGPASRTEVMRSLFGDELPEPVLARRSKAFFDDAFFSDHSRSFVAGWDGAGVDPALVDLDGLREIWLGPEPDPRSFLLLKAAWLAASGHVPDGGVCAKLRLPGEDGGFDGETRDCSEPRGGGAVL